MKCFSGVQRLFRLSFRAQVAVVVFGASLAAHAQTMIWVATNGNDGWSGLQANYSGGTNGPKRTLAGARNLIRTLKTAGTLSPQGAIVTVRPGRYKLYTTFQLNSRDSGLSGARIVWRSEVVGQAILDGGREVTKWLDSAHRPPMPQVNHAAQRYVQVADLTQSGIHEAGRMRHNAPNYDILPEWAEFFFGEKRMTLAQWPNGLGCDMTGLGPGNSYDTPTVTGDLSTMRTLNYTRKSLTETATDYWIRGTLNMRQYNQFQERVTWIDKGVGALRVAMEDGNLQDDARRAYYDPLSKGRFTLVNSLYELDKAGEYYIDRGNMLLYFFPTGKLAENRAYLSMNPGPLVSMTGVAYLDWQGFLMEGGRQNALNILRGTSVVVRGCHIRNCGGYGVWAFDGNAVTVRSCEVNDIGETGIHLEGGDRSSFRRANHLAENNYVHNVGAVQPFYRPCIRLAGFGLTARGNELAYHRHQAVHYFGNDILIEKNDIHDVVTDACDAAAIYTGDGDWTTRGNVVRYNYLHGIRKIRAGYHIVHGVYMDDMNSSTNVYGNMFRDVEQPIQIGAGHDNNADYNVFVDCFGGVRIDDRGITAPQYWIDDFFRHAADVPWSSGPWRVRYPGAYATLTSTNYRYPTGNTVIGNVCLRSRFNSYIQGPMEFWGVNQNAPPEILKSENNVITDTQQFVDEPAGNFTPIVGSMAQLNGFKTVQVADSGVHKDTFINPASWR